MLPLQVLVGGLGSLLFWILVVLVPIALYIWLRAKGLLGAPGGKNLGP